VVNLVCFRVNAVYTSTILVVERQFMLAVVVLELQGMLMHMCVVRYTMDIKYVYTFYTGKSIVI
jgi:hypothetical protein